MKQEQLKARVAAEAIEYVRARLVPDTVLGIGTGTTVNHFIDRLPALRESLKGCVASSNASAERASRLGLPVIDLNRVGEVALYVDGADEADGQRRLIKGGGGALTREKIVATASDHFLCIIDESKRRESLGTFPLPIEVLPMAVELISRQLTDMGGQPTVRAGFVSDEGNTVIDVVNLDFSDPHALECEINQLPGVVSNGIFARRPADCVMLASASGIDIY